MLSNSCLFGIYVCDMSSKCLTSVFTYTFQNLLFCKIISISIMNFFSGHMNTFKCAAGSLKCATLNQCVPLTAFCNGKHECADKSDEGDFCSGEK